MENWNFFADFSLFALSMSSVKSGFLLKWDVSNHNLYVEVNSTCRSWSSYKTAKEERQAPSWITSIHVDSMPDDKNEGALWKLTPSKYHLSWKIKENQESKRWKISSSLAKLLSNLDVHEGEIFASSKKVTIKSDVASIALN